MKKNVLKFKLIRTFNDPYPRWRRCPKMKQIRSVIYDSILGVESLPRTFKTYYNSRAYIKRYIYTLFAK